MESGEFGGKNKSCLRQPSPLFGVSFMSGWAKSVPTYRNTSCHHQTIHNPPILHNLPSQKRRRQNTPPCIFFFLVFCHRFFFCLRQQVFEPMGLPAWSCSVEVETEHFIINQAVRDRNSRQSQQRTRPARAALFLRAIIFQPQLNPQSRWTQGQTPFCAERR